jgi:hypothetical protein
MHQPIMIPPGPLRDLDLRSILRAYEQRDMLGEWQGGAECNNLIRARLSCV